MKIKKITILSFFMILSVFSFGEITEKDMKIYSTKYDESKYPNGSVVTLYIEDNIKINSDMTKEYYRRDVQKIVSYKGKKGYSEYKIYFDGRYESIEIVKAVTVNYENEKYIEIPVDTNSMRIIDDPSEEGFMDYLVHKMGVIAFPAVDEGSIIDVTYRIKSKDREKITYRVNFVAAEPILYKKIEVEVDKSIKLNIYKENFDKNIKIEQQELNGNIVYSFEKEGLEQIESEDSMTPIYTFAPVLYISMYQNFDEIKETMIKKFSKDKLEPSKNIKNLAEALTDTSKTEREKALTLKEYVAKNIQNIPVDDLLLRDIKSPEELIKKGYGAIYDITALYVALLRGVGIEAYPVIAGIDGNFFKYEKNYFDVEKFRTPFVMAKIDGKQVYIDPTSEFYRIGEINANNEMVLLLKEGKTEFLNMNPEIDKKAKIKENYKIKIDENGNSITEIKVEYFGHFAASIRSKYKYMTPVQKKQDYQNILASISQNTEPLDLLPEIEIGDKVYIKYSYKNSNFAQKDSKFIYFDIPSSIVPLVLRIEPKNRKYPYQSLEDTVSEKSIEIEYPKEYKGVIIPKSIKLKEKLFKISRNVENKDNKIKIEDTIEYIPGFVVGKEYHDIYSSILKLAKPENYKIMLMKK
jgi:hypothetical protein